VTPIASDVEDLSRASRARFVARDHRAIAPSPRAEAGVPLRRRPIGRMPFVSGPSAPKGRLSFLCLANIARGEPDADSVCGPMYYLALALKRSFDNQAEARRQPSWRVDFDPCPVCRQVPHDAGSGRPTPADYHGMEEGLATPELTALNRVRKAFRTCVHADSPKRASISTAQ
jgi:hypothetical protein